MKEGLTSSPLDIVLESRSSFLGAPRCVDITSGARVVLYSSRPLRGVTPMLELQEETDKVIVRLDCTGFMTSSPYHPVFTVASQLSLPDIGSGDYL